MRLKKKLILSIVCLIWSCFVISQTLEPIRQTIENEKYFSFTIEQSRFIAKKFEYSIYQDSLIKLFEIDITRYEQLTREKDFIIFGLETKIENLNTIQNNDQLHIDELNKTIKKKDKQIKRGKFVKWLLGTGLAVVTGILILK